MTSMLDDNWRKITRKLIERCQITTIGSQQKRVTSSHNVEKNFKKIKIQLLQCNIPKTTDKKLNEMAAISTRTLPAQHAMLLRLREEATDLK